MVDFCGENLCGLLTFVAPKVPWPQILERKLSRTPTKLRNSQKFSPSKFSCYTVYFRLAARMRLLSRHLGPLASFFLGTHKCPEHAGVSLLVCCSSYTADLTQCRNLLIHTPARPQQVTPMTSVCTGSRIKGHTQRGQQPCAVRREEMSLIVGPLMNTNK